MMQIHCPLCGGVATVFGHGCRYWAEQRHGRHPRRDRESGLDRAAKLRSDPITHLMSVEPQGRIIFVPRQSWRRSQP